MSRATHLKIKLKTLAAEARIIRKEERKALAFARHWKVMDHPKDPFLSGRLMTEGYQSYRSLSEHRRGIVRSTARTNNIAYGFLRGRAYSEIEAKALTSVDLAAVWKLVKRFGGREDLGRWAEWQTAAVQHLDAQGCPAAKIPPQSEYARFTKAVA